MFGRLTNIWRDNGLSLHTVQVITQRSLRQHTVDGKEKSILKISWTDMTTNHTVRERTGQDTLESIIRERKLKWFGDTYRMDSNRIARQVMDWTLPHFRRKRGRPKSVTDFNSEKRSGFVGSDMGCSGFNEGSLGMERLYCPMCFYSTRKN